MNLKSIQLVWIAVKDLKKAIAFYTNVIGMKLKEESPEYGWAELEAPQGGPRLGLAQMQGQDPNEIKAGQNAITTFTVDSLDRAISTLPLNEITLIGEVMEVPGHVKMQMVKDRDGNHFQLVEMLSPAKK